MSGAGRRSRDAGAWHPSLRALLRYHRGELRVAGAESVREHVAACRGCTEALLDLAAFEAPRQCSDEELEDAWSGCRWQLDSAPPEPQGRGRCGEICLELTRRLRGEGKHVLRLYGFGGER